MIRSPSFHSPLYLASASPRRHDILKQLRIAHYVIRVPEPDGEDEPQLHGEAPQDYVRRTAREKALHAAEWFKQAPADQLRRRIHHAYAMEDREHACAMEGRDHAGDSPYILCADTTVAMGDHILGKPHDTRDAVRTLTQLSGKTHNVYTAVALWHADQLFETLSVSTVRFKTLQPTEIDAYCATGEHMGKAGAYGVQGAAAAFVAHMEGSHTGIVGLPAYETTMLLAKAGYLPHPIQSAVPGT